MSYPWMPGTLMRRTPPERFALYSRWSMYVLSSFEAFGAALVIATAWPLPLVGAIALGVAVLAHTAVCIGLLRAGIVAYLGGPPVWRGWLIAALGLAVVAIVGALAVLPLAPVGLTWVDGDLRAVVVLLVATSTVASCTPLLIFRWLALGAFAVSVVVGWASLVGRHPLDALAVGVAVGSSLGVLIMCVGIFSSYRVSVWMLGVVWEQERNRVVHARLAVAEERLRFSRDLHDVFGRTLSVVAVKSELAAELAARGRPGAADQMMEVRQIAHEALREVRDVVAGYRSADLGAELAGARSVLRSAGIATTVSGEELVVPAPVQQALAWVVREGVTNVVRHSEAGWCAIQLGSAVDGVRLEIVNDGARAASGQRGSGITGLRERVAPLGGEITTWADGGRFGLVALVPHVVPTPQAHLAGPESTFA